MPHSRKHAREKIEKLMRSALDSITSQFPGEVSCVIAVSYGNKAKCVANIPPDEGISLMLATAVEMDKARNCG